MNMQISGQKKKPGGKKHPHFYPCQDIQTSTNMQNCTSFICIPESDWILYFMIDYSKQFSHLNFAKENLIIILFI